MKQLTIEGITTDIERKRIKNMYLKVLPPDGQVRVSAPMRMPEQEIISFIQSKAQWISEQQEKLKNRHLQENIDYLAGDTVYLWGRPYTLRVEATETKGYAYPQGNKLVLKARSSCTAGQRLDIMNRYYREVLTEQLPGLIVRWERVIGVKSEGFSIRDMKTRWGTCNIRTKKICLNLQLAKKPPKCLEYVVVHELVHLLEGSHNRVFKNYMDHFLPNWRMVKKELNGAE